jgi:hypothetical protein
MSGGLSLTRGGEPTCSPSFGKSCSANTAPAPYFGFDFRKFLSETGSSPFTPPINPAGRRCGESWPSVWPGRRLFFLLNSPAAVAAQVRGCIAALRLASLRSGRPARARGAARSERPARRRGGNPVRGRTLELGRSERTIMPAAAAPGARWEVGGLRQQPRSKPHCQGGEPR